MISLFGKIALYFALGFALLQSSVPFFGGVRSNIYTLALARPAAWGQLFCILIAYFLLTMAFVTNDFSIGYVALNSHPSLPFFYRVTAVFGAHEGSILLWILILNLWTFAFSITPYRALKEYSLVLAILGMISVSFLLFLIFTSNPFLLTSIKQTGNDLNPLLQDPGLIIHPPMLYIGYVGFSVAFAITEAALFYNQLDAIWAKITRQFAIAAWCFLTFGILLGSWWAYRVLGWGGFWFWDPVENASLLPWLSGTALIHVLILVEKQKIASLWAAFLAIICFILSVLGTFLVRSGILISAHTFASDPTRGIFLLLLLALLSFAALILYMIRFSKMMPSSFFITLRSRELGLLLNSAFLFIAMLTILVGTLYPLLLDALHLGSISVGAPYFNKVMLPLVFILLLLMNYFPFLPWQKEPSKITRPNLLRNFLISFSFIFFLLWSFTQSVEITTWIGVALSGWILFNTFPLLRKLPRMSLAHMGFAILVIGILLSSAEMQERDVRMKVGDRADIGPYQFYFLNTVGIQGANYRGIRADFRITKNQYHITHLYPEKRIYTVRDMVMTKVDIHPGLFRDLYIALGEPLDHEEWSVRIYYKPFIRLIWLGGIIMILGGLCAFI